MGADEQGRRIESIDLTKTLFASIVLVEPSLAHLDRAFTYAVEQPVGIGAHVRAPFRGKNRRGIVVELLDESDVEKTLPIKELLGPGLTPELVDLARWVAERYLATLGEALAAVLPERVASEEGGTELRTPSPNGIPKTPSGAIELQRALRSTQEVFGTYPDSAALLDSIVAKADKGFVWRPLPHENRASAIRELVSCATAAGQGALVLVPETKDSAVVEGLHELGEAVAWLGSDRSARVRYRDWLALRAGNKSIGVGGRGAVFAPIQDLGLIVVDDEAHVAYKEARSPRFHARTIAAERARRDSATLLLIGTPPSVEARTATTRGRYTFFSEPREAERRKRSSVTVIDERTRLVPAGRTMTLAKEALSAGGRVVILTHKAGEEAQRVAERASRILAPPTSALLDARTPRAELRRALKKAQLIVATPVVAKDFVPDGVGLLAIVEADAALSQPGFRAVEEAFATWWRVAHWAPRVGIETQNPRHPAIDALVRWDPDILARAEAVRRKEAGYPPFAALARIDVPAARARDVVRELSALHGIEVLGPVEREGGGSAVVARAGRRDTLLAALGPVVAEWRRNDEPMRVDVDPWEVLVPKWRS